MGREDVVAVISGFTGAVSRDDEIDARCSLDRSAKLSENVFDEK
jgi:hypothetical protein